MTIIAIVLTVATNQVRSIECRGGKLQTAKSRLPLTPNPAAQAHRRARESRRWRRPPSSAQIRAGTPQPTDRAAERSSGGRGWILFGIFDRSAERFCAARTRQMKIPCSPPEAYFPVHANPPSRRNGQFADRHPHQTGKGLVQDSDGATRRPSLVRDSDETPRLGRDAETRTRRRDSDETPRLRDSDETPRLGRD